MQSSVKLEIEGKAASFSKVWVHLKAKCKLKPVPFKVTIPESELRNIFDPYDTKPATESWCDFIRNQIESLGTFILEAYFDAMAQKDGDEEKRYEWVIAKLDSIVENAEGVELVGQAEPFEPTAY